MDAAVVLAQVDAALAPTGGVRVEAPASFCPAAGARAMPGVDNRDFLCGASELVGAWRLDRLRADGGERVDARLELRRFRSPSLATEAHDEAVARYGGGTVGIREGALSWCYAEVAWGGDLLVTVEYGCHISLPHVPALRDTVAAIWALAEPDPRGARGIVGSHSGWSHLRGGSPEALVVDPSRRFTRYARVQGVAADDVLWIRADPGATHVGDAVGKLAPTATCVPVVLYAADRSWWRVRGPEGVEGWSSARYLRLEALGACRRP